MTLFADWSERRHTPAEQAIARGEAIFNARPITISGVAGLNDALGLPTSANSKVPFCAVWLPAHRTSTTAPLPPWTTWWTFTTLASGWA
jgi:hypothetical protein